jgi:hypothetical protein
MVVGVGTNEGVGREEVVGAGAEDRNPLPLPGERSVVGGSVEEMKVVIEGEGEGDGVEGVPDGGQSESYSGHTFNGKANRH